MFTQTQTVTKTQIIGEPEFHITGDSTKGTRTLRITFPVKDSDGNPLPFITKTYTGQSFNNIYSKFASDRQLIEAVAPQFVKGVDVPENLENVVLEATETVV